MNINVILLMSGVVLNLLKMMIYALFMELVIWCTVIVVAVKKKVVVIKNVVLTIAMSVSVHVS